MTEARQAVPKTYIFKDPVPNPVIHDIYKVREEEKDATAADTSDGEDESEFLWGDEKKESPPTEKKPTWLVRGDLSSTSSVDDMLQLEDLSEDTILLNLRIRYKANLIYTYIGSIMVAVNPYRQLPIYTDRLVKQYDGGIIGVTNPPHLFAIGNEIFTHMVRDSQDQCLLVSGESGSGKTETVKLLLEYLAKVNASTRSTVTEQILEATPILESFGNAKTIRNHNSSRVGKYLEIIYDCGRILGARLSQYLLEKSRIVHQHYGERNFHIFYEFLAGISPGVREKLHLKQPKDYQYLNKFEKWQIDGKSDGQDFIRSMQCFEVLKFSQQEKQSVFDILASILHLGNMEYTQHEQIAHGKEILVIDTDELVPIISKQLQINNSKLTPLLTSRFMIIRGEQVSVSLSLSDALNTRDALAKALYSQLYTWLVHKINRRINPTAYQNKSIALLDIFGFENFRENSFEQLCINYANEQLQHLFNKAVFEMEQDRYSGEGIEWESLELPDNEETVELFSLKPHGLLRVLDDESQFPKATDQTYLDKINSHHDENDLYVKPKTERLEFSVQHYAAQVTYSVRGFIQKNKDMLRSDIVDLLCSSKNKIVSQVFSDHKESSSMRHLNKITGRITTLKPRTPTVAASFQDSLTVLLEKINRCKPWFIRCLKPNNSKSAMLFDTDIVSEQIKATGMLETVRIRSAGYPVHLSCEDFLERYEYLYRAEPDDDTDASEFCQQILKAEFEAEEVDDYQMGTNHLFLKEAFYQHVEQLRCDVVMHAVQVIENNIKAILLRRRFVRQRKAAIKIQAFWRAYFHRVAYKAFRKNVSRCQANLRRRWQRQHFEKMIVELTIERDIRWSEADIRKELTRQELKAIIGLEIPADLAFLYNLSSDVPAVHSHSQIIPISNKIFTQNLGLRLPEDANNYIFTNFTEKHFQHHLFAAKREAIHHPFLIKIREKDYKQAVTLFKLVLRFMYDAHISEQKEVLLGNYIIQQVLSSPNLADELFVQICVQMWAKHQSDTSREKISHLISMCLSTIAPSSALYKYLLKYTSDHAFNGYKALTQHKLLRSFSVDYPSVRYYPPTLLEWEASRKRAKMVLSARLPRGNEVCCNVDSWTTGEDCAKLALCAYGLFENRHGWTVELHDEDESVYGVAGHDHLFDLIGEVEIPSGIPHNVAPFLVSTSQSESSKTKHSKRNRDRPHRPDIKRQPSYDFTDIISVAQSDLASSISSIRDNLRIVPRPDLEGEPGPSYTQSIPLSPDLPKANSIAERLQISLQKRRGAENSPTSPLSNGISRQESTSTDRSPSQQESSSSLHRLEMERSRAELALTVPKPPVKSHSRLNERPANVDHPGMARKSLMNQRYIGSESSTMTPRSETTSYMPSASQQTVLQHGNGGRKSRKAPSVTFRDQVMHPIADSQMNERYASRQSTKAPPRAMSLKANLNSRYMDTSSDQASLTPRRPEDYWNGLYTADTPRYPAPPPLTPPVELESLHENSNSPSLSRQSSVQEPPITHQDIMSQINNEILGLANNRYSKNAGKSAAYHEGGAVAKNVARRKQDQRLATVESNGTMNRSDITGSDLDDWVDKVFDPIMQDNTVNSLSNTDALHRTLKGNGDNKCEYENWVQGLSDMPDIRTLQNVQELRQVLKGDGDSHVLSDTNNNNNNGDIIKNAENTSSSGILEESRTSTTSPLPFSYSESSAPSHLLRPPSSMNNLNAPPSTIRSKRSNNPVGPTAWNMFGHVGHAKIKHNINSKITNLADKLIANVKTNDEQTHQKNQTTEHRTSDVTPVDVAEESREDGPDVDIADTVYDTDDGNVAVTKSGGITRGKAPMRKRVFHWSSVGPDNEGSEISSATVSPKSVAMSESDGTIEANNNNSNNSPAREPARHRESAVSQPRRGNRPRVKSPVIESRTEDLMKEALKTEQHRPHLEKVGVRVVPVTNEPKSHYEKSAPRYDLNAKVVHKKKHEIKRVLKSSPQASKVSKKSSQPTKSPSIPSVKSAPNLQFNCNSNSAKRVYWEQLKPGEAPVKIIIPSPKKRRRRGAESAWNRLLVALKIIKPSMGRAESSDSLKEGLTGWKKVRYAIKQYLSEQRKTQEEATANLLSFASREHREITEALAFESGQSPSLQRVKDAVSGHSSVVTDQPQEIHPVKTTQNGSMSDSKSGDNRASEYPELTDLTDNVFEIPTEQAIHDGSQTSMSQINRVPSLSRSTGPQRLRRSLNNKSRSEVNISRGWGNNSKSEIQTSKKSGNLSPTWSPRNVLQNTRSRLRKTGVPIVDFEVESSHSQQGTSTGHPFTRDLPTMKSRRNDAEKELCYHILKPNTYNTAASDTVQIKPKPSNTIPPNVADYKQPASEDTGTTAPWLQEARMRLNKSSNKEANMTTAENVTVPDNAASTSTYLKSTSSSRVQDKPNSVTFQTQFSVDSDQSSLDSPKTVSDRTKKYAKALLSNTKSKTDSREEKLLKKKCIEDMLGRTAPPASVNYHKNSTVELSQSESSSGAAPPQIEVPAPAHMETPVIIAADENNTTNMVKFLYKQTKIQSHSENPITPAEPNNITSVTAAEPNNTLPETDTLPSAIPPTSILSTVLPPTALPPAAMPPTAMPFYPHPQMDYHVAPQVIPGYFPRHPHYLAMGYSDGCAGRYPSINPLPSQTYSKPLHPLTIPPPSTFLNPTLSPGLPLAEMDTKNENVGQNGSSHGLLKPQYQASQEESIQQNDEMRNSANGGETRDKRLLLLSNPSVSASNKDNPTVSTTEEALPDSILKPSSKHAKATLAKPKLVSSIVENNPAYNSARYSEKIKIIKTDQNSNKTTERKQIESVRFLSVVSQEDTDESTPIPQPVTRRVTAASMNGAPRKVGKLVWPPVKEEAPKLEKQVGKLLIEESDAERLQRATELKGHLKKSASNKTAQGQQVNHGPARSLAERLELLEKKIGDRPPPDNPIVQRSKSLAFPEPAALHSHSITETKSAPVTPITTKEAQAPAVVMNGVKRQVSQNTETSPSSPSTPVAAEPTDYASAVNVVTTVVVNSVVKAKHEPVSERLPVRGVYHLLAAVRTQLHTDDSSLYLSYKDVPWWLGVRKEVFSPNETLSNPKIIDLIFYQIVRDVFQYPSIRIPPDGRSEVTKILGEVTLQTISSQSVSKEQKWNIIELTRSWPFYFSRIFMVVGQPDIGELLQKSKYETTLRYKISPIESDRISEIEFIGVCHDGVRFGRRESAVTAGDDLSHQHLTELQHILYEDIALVMMPKEDIFELTAEHKTYKVYTPKAGVLANMINAYGIEAMKGGDFVEATEDHFTCEPGYLSYKKGDVIKLKPERMSFEVTSLPPPQPGWLYGSFNGRMGSVSEGTIKPLSKKEIKRAGSFQDTRSRHGSGVSEGEPSGSQSPGKFSMLEFSMMYFRENLDRYSTRPNEMGINSNIKLIENLKLSGIKRRKSFTKTKDAPTFGSLILDQSRKLRAASYNDKLQRQESWSWKEQADMIKWTKTAIPVSLLKLPTEQMNQTAVECFFSVQQFMGDQLLDQGQTDIDCAFTILKACHNCPELRDEIYCQLSRQTTNNKSPQSQSCLRGWRLFTLVACWFSPSDILKPFLINYLQQNASDPSRPYHTAAHNCLQQLRKTIKYGGRKNVPSSEEVAAITDGKLNKRQMILLPGGVPFVLNISPSTVVQDIIDEVCAKLGVVSQMEQDEYTVFAMVESDNEYARLKREEYVMDVITEMRLQRKECTLMFERTSWYFPLRLESATYDYLDMMFSQCIPDYIDGYLLSLDHKNRIPAKQLDDIITIAALLYRASGHDSQPRALKEIDNYLPGPILSLGLLRHQQFLTGVQDRLEQRLINYNTTDCKLEALHLLKKWPLFGASFFIIQCLTEPKITGECLLAVNRAGVHFLHHKTHRVILSYPFTEIISSRKISGDHKLSDDRFLDVKVGNNMVQKVIRVETSQGADIAHLIGQYVKAVNSSAKLTV